jgi:hypothetical protein
MWTGNSLFFIFYSDVLLVVPKLNSDFNYVTFFPSFNQDKMMLRPAERLIAFTILHQGYSLKLANPFVPLLINVSFFICSFVIHFGLLYPLPSLIARAENITSKFFTNSFSLWETQHRLILLRKFVEYFFV